MKKVFVFLFVAFMVASCTPKTATTPASDSTIVTVDTVQVDSVAVDTVAVK